MKAIITQHDLISQRSFDSNGKVISLTMPKRQECELPDGYKLGHSQTVDLGMGPQLVCIWVQS